MARIRKIHRMIKTTKANSEECSESEIEKNSMKSSRCNVQNSRRICLIDRNRRVFQNLRSYASYFDNMNGLIITNKKCLSCSILSNTRGKNWTNCDSKSTQTSENVIEEAAVRKISNCSTQTGEFMKIRDFIGNDEINRTRSDITVLTSSYNSRRKNAEMENTELKSEIEKNSSPKTLITLHTNEKIYKNNKISPSKIPIPLKYSPKTKPEEIKQSRKKKRNLFFARKKSRKIMHCNDTIRNTVEGIKQGDSSECDCRFSAYDELVYKMKKYSEITAEWSIRMFNMFSDLGISLKKSLNNIYKLYEAQAVQSLTFCECEKYRQEVNRLAAKMNELELEVKSLSAKAEEKRENVEENEEISRRVDKMGRDVECFASLKREVENLKKQVVGGGGAGSATAGMTSFPPPPPPPLPPPPMPITCHSTSFIRVVQDERKLRRFDISRPIITLEDILKVKLKKISVTDF